MMIRSAKFYLKYQTLSKTDEIIKIYNEYIRLVNCYIPLFYHNPNQPWNTATVHSIESFLGGGYKSNACKQALETVESLKKKYVTKCPLFNGEMILEEMDLLKRHFHG